MSTFICTSCRACIRQMSRKRAFCPGSAYSPNPRSVEPSIRPSLRFLKCTPLRMYSHAPKSSAPEDSLVQYTAYKSESKDSQPEPSKPQINIAALLSTPTWSVEEHFKTPFEKRVGNEKEITPQKLHHLLRLCALPQPQSEEEEQKMLDTLRAQLNFVKEIQKVDTEGIEPLQSIRDETEEGIEDNTINLAKMQEYLDAKEDIIGRSKRPRRRKNEPVDTKGEEDWDCLSTAGERVVTAGGAYFVVRSGKGPTKHSKGATKSDKEDPMALRLGREPAD